MFVRLGQRRILYGRTLDDVPKVAGVKTLVWRIFGSGSQLECVEDCGKVFQPDIDGRLRWNGDVLRQVSGDSLIVIESDQSCPLQEIENAGDLLIQQAYVVPPSVYVRELVIAADAIVTCVGLKDIVFDTAIDLLSG